MAGTAAHCKPLRLLHWNILDGGGSRLRGIGDVVHSLSLSEMCDEADGIGGYAGEGAPVHVRACDLIDRDGQLLGMLRSTHAMAALVRPDGHVGALAGDVESSLAAVKRACPPLPTNGP